MFATPLRQAIKGRRVWYVLAADTPPGFVMFLCPDDALAEQQDREYVRGIPARIQTLVVQ